MVFFFQLDKSLPVVLIFISSKAAPLGVRFLCISHWLVRVVDKLSLGNYVYIFFIRSITHQSHYSDFNIALGVRILLKHCFFLSFIDRSSDFAGLLILNFCKALVSRRSFSTVGFNFFLSCHWSVDNKFKLWLMDDLN